jgi:hypothetical protein
MTAYTTANPPTIAGQTLRTTAVRTAELYRSAGISNGSALSWIGSCYRERRRILMNRNVCALALCGLTTAIVAAQTGQPEQRGNAPKSGETITVTGCLGAGNNNTFTLTAAPQQAAEAPTGTTATTPVGTKVTKTITYTLTGAKPETLKPHVGHTVAITGTEAAPQMTTGMRDTSKGAGTPQGTSGSTPSGGGKPNVETTAQAQIVVRQLSADNVKMVSANCSLVK